MKIQTVMISCAQRTIIREATINALLATGIVSRVKAAIHPCNPGSPAGTNEAARDALTGIRTDHPLLFVEDDLLLASDFAWHVERAIHLNALTYLYLNDSEQRLLQHFGHEVTTAILHRRPIDRGPRRFLRPAAPFGTQAVVVPARLVETVQSLAWEAGDLPFDTRLQRWLQTNVQSESAWSSLPHPVQHLNARQGKIDTEPKAQRLSMSFGMPTTGRDL